MRFSILHISDLHRDLTDEVNNAYLLESLRKDFEQYGRQDPQIVEPSLCIVSGDLVYGAKPGSTNATDELKRQAAQAEEFLVSLADTFFNGVRDNIVIVPGNHDVSFPDFMGSMTRLAIPSESDQKSALVKELFEARSRLRWSWLDLCFYRITDEARYKARLTEFASIYNRFYRGQRTFSLEPEKQFDVFDFPDLGFCVLALNSCYDNDPFRRAGAFHPASVAESCAVLRAPKRTGRLIGGVWHHSLFGGPTKDDYLDVQVLQILMDSGVSIGFHGHQHLTECADEQYRIGPGGRKMTIVSAGTLCAAPANLAAGVPRCYNVVELDTSAWTGRVHQRQMVNRLYNLPVWGPGHFNTTNSGHLDFTICKPLAARPEGLDTHLALDQADELLGAHKWEQAAVVLARIPDHPSARPLLVKALTEMGNNERTIEALWPPQSIAEAVLVGDAIIEAGRRTEAVAFLELPIVKNGNDASIGDVVRRMRVRGLV